MRSVRSWVPAAAWLTLLVGLGVVLVTQGAGDSLWALAILLPLVWLASPLVYPQRVTHAEAKARAAADDHLVRIYVRPGALFCVILRWRLQRLAREALWVDIWADAEAERLVRRLGKGAELIPVVIVGDRTRHNPPHTWVAHQLLLDRAAPTDDPEDDSRTA